MNSIQLDSLKMSLGLDPDLKISESRLRDLWVEQHLQSTPASRQPTTNSRQTRSRISAEIRSREASAA